MGHDEITEKLKVIAATEPRVTLVVTDGRALRKTADGDYEARIAFEVKGKPSFGVVFLSSVKPIDNFLTEFRGMVEVAGEMMGAAVSA